MTRIAIVGSGPSAVYTLARLADAVDSFDIVIFEAGRLGGVGTPYNAQMNHKAMLANIASIEIPPLSQTLEAWLRAQDDPTLERLHVVRDDIGDRTFFPRVVLGAYYHDEFMRLIERMRAAGRTVELRTRTRVMDIAALDSGVLIVSTTERRARQTAVFDYVVVATGHQLPARKPIEPVAMRAPYPSTPLVPPSGGAIGVLGASLSAIDVATAAAAHIGEFVRGPSGRLCYRANPGARLSISLMSRGGLLPEADFYCPIPYEPLSICTREALGAIAANGDENPLDAAFDLFRDELTRADPDYARSISLATLTADTFASAYFAARGAEDPIAWARANLDETRANYAARRTVPWRYAILRMHEGFGAVAARWPARDRDRFKRGLKRVFVDNYAAVPPESIERLLAMNEAGVLDVVRLGERYRIEARGAEAAAVAWTGGRREFDVLVDARGQKPLDEDDFPFPTLRLQIKANNLARAGAAPPDREVAVADDYRLAHGPNVLERILCLSIPFLLGSRPFSQGLTSSAEMGEIAARSILAEIARGPRPTDQADAAGLRDLLRTVETSSPIFCLDSGLVIAGPPRERSGR